MQGNRVEGFTVQAGGKVFAVCDTFEEATQVASSRMANEPSPESYKIQTASSDTIRGVGAAPVRTWNFDTNIGQWVEFIR